MEAPKPKFSNEMQACEWKAALSLWDTVINVLEPSARRDPQQCLPFCDTERAHLQHASFSSCFRRHRTCEGWSPCMRHVSRTHRVDLDWLFAIHIKYVNTAQRCVNQGSFSLTHLFGVYDIKRTCSPSFCGICILSRQEHVEATRRNA